MRRSIGAVLSTVLLATLALGTPTSAASVEQTLHDEVVKAYTAAKTFVAGLESSVSDTARSAYDTARRDLDALEARINGAVNMAGDAAVREYRDIQHALDGIGRGADSFLHQAGHTLEDVEHQAWAALQDGVAKVGDAIHNVIDGLHL